ncbi:MAG: hypothetical protein ACPGRZ_13295 [Alphaproteobacteria bacterium]
MLRQAAATIAAACSLFTAGARADDTNFSQRPGFAEYFAANPPSDALPGPDARHLLKRYRPRLFIGDAAETDPPIRFYEDYIAQGRLLARDGSVIADDVTPSLLNAHREDPYVVFEHIPTKADTGRVMYGRIDRERFALGGRDREFTFLTWTAVFRVSGVAAGISALQGFGLALAGDLHDWHQLDHYTAVTLALDETNTPVAAMFQQHNYLQTVLFGVDAPFPEDGRIGVDVALRSNEFFPHRAGRTVRRAGSFMSPELARYLTSGKDAPFRHADDITDPVTEVAYELSFLPPSYAFYMFKGFLGEKRLLPGRSGPPGASYNTLPAFKPLHRQMIAFHWRDGDPDYADWIAEPDRGFGKLAERFAALLAARGD